jgi:hypothetical protein
MDSSRRIQGVEEPVVGGTEDLGHEPDERLLTALASILEPTAGR